MKTVRVSRIYEYPDDTEDQEAIDNALEIFGKEAPYFLEEIRDFVSAKVLTKEEKDNNINLKTMKIQLVKETDIYGYVWWIVKQDNGITKYFSDESEAEDMFKKCIENLKSELPKIEIIKEETI